MTMQFRFPTLFKASELFLKQFFCEVFTENCLSAQFLFPLRPSFLPEASPCCFPNDGFSQTETDR